MISLFGPYIVLLSTIGVFLTRTAHRHTYTGHPFQVPLLIGAPEELVSFIL
jgi:hypothetical protein